MAPYKRPRIIQFVDELPKTVSGEILRTDLRRSESQLRRARTRSNMKNISRAISDNF